MNRRLKKYIPSCVWRWGRRRWIIFNHRRVATICNRLISNYYNDLCFTPLKPKCDFGTDKIIWQYWAQGYASVPDVVRDCLASVDEYCKDFVIIRLSDSTVSDYLDLPEYINKKRDLFSTAHFSDLLRLLLLSTYGGMWLDATVMLTGQIPREYMEFDFFMYQRNPQEKSKRYWENTYAYYFGWRKGFRVNVLNSIMMSKREGTVITNLAGLLLKWWRDNNEIPDYFFFQILFDVLMKNKLAGKNCPIVSDCPPHYLQQSINDPKFSIMDRETILSSIPMHKLTYKVC